MDIFENLYSNPINNLKMHYEKIWNDQKLGLDKFGGNVNLF
jgi:hypothetical protein